MLMKEWRRCKRSGEGSGFSRNSKKKSKVAVFVVEYPDFLYKLLADQQMAFLIFQNC
jgi:hypothetical protein